MDQTNLVQHIYSTVHCTGGLSDALGDEKCIHPTKQTKHLYRAHRYQRDEDFLCEKKNRGETLE